MSSAGAWRYGSTSGGGDDSGAAWTPGPHSTQPADTADGVQPAQTKCPHDRMEPFLPVGAKHAKQDGAKAVAMQVNSWVVGGGGPLRVELGRWEGGRERDGVETHDDGTGKSDGFGGRTGRRKIGCVWGHSNELQHSSTPALNSTLVST